MLSADQSHGVISACGLICKVCYNASDAPIEVFLRVYLRQWHRASRCPSDRE